MPEMCEDRKYACCRDLKSVNEKLVSVGRERDELSMKCSGFQAQCQQLTEQKVSLIPVGT